jgi:hypothetical protein
MGDRNLFLGPHVITAQSQRGIGIIGTIENRGPPGAPYGPYAFPPFQRRQKIVVPAVPMTAPRYFRTAARFRGAHAGGLVLRRKKAAGKWGKATYSLARTSKAS